MIVIAARHFMFDHLVGGRQRLENVELMADLFDRVVDAVRSCSSQETVDPQNVSQQLLSQRLSLPELASYLRELDPTKQHSEEVLLQLTNLCSSIQPLPEGRARAGVADAVLSLHHR